jgi:outer membrane protein assembly factor BamB
MGRNWKLTVMVAAIVAALVAPLGRVADAATPTIALSEKGGPQLTLLTVSGAGFASSSAYDVKFDGTVLAQGTTASDGSFTASLKVPKSALPGTHQITATVGPDSASAPFIVRNAWRELSDNSRHSGSAIENIVTASTVSGLSSAWSIAGGSKTQPDVVNGEVVIAIGTTVQAFSGTDGDQLWSFDTGGAVTATPAVVDNLVFAGSTTGTLYALDLEHGTITWQYQANKSLHVAPGAVEGYVILPVAGAGLYVALRSTDGSVLWTKQLGGTQVAMTPTIDDTANAVYLSDAKAGHLTAVKLTDGTTIWQVPVASGIAGPVALSNGVLFARTFAGDLVALRQTDGVMLWSVPIGGVPSAGATVDGNSVFAGQPDGIAAYSANTGALRWKFTTTTRATTPTIAGGVVYFATRAGVTGLDESNGSKLWSAPVAKSRRPPAVVDGTVYVNGAQLVAFRLPSGP